MGMNCATIEKLLTMYKNDKEMIELIVDALDSFERYHQAIYALELKQKLHQAKAIDDETFREEYPAMDRVRTTCHNAVIANVSIMNRLTEQAGLPPVYDGIVSEERPYRTELADAILAFVADVITNRVR